MKDLYSKYAQNHIHKTLFMSTAWMIRGYEIYKAILSDPDTPQRRRQIMARNIQIIDAAAEGIPEDCRQIIMDKLIHNKPLPPYDKEVNRNLVNFIIEVAYRNFQEMMVF